MPHIFDRTYTRRELLGYTGNPAQLGGIRAVELATGRERGVRAFDVATGTGFEFTVVADRALDITRATFRGRSLVFHSPTGQAHPAYFEPLGLGWLRTFAGGLVATTGLSYLGSPEDDQGEPLGLHGRIGNLPAEELGFWTEWRDDECWMFVKGTVTEGAIFAPHLRMTRLISAKLGGNSLVIEDTVENRGGEPAPFMLLYHCNFGFPLLSPEAQLVTNSTQVLPRDEAAAAGLESWNRFHEPQPGYAEQVFYHDMATDNAGIVHVALINPALDGGMGIYMEYPKKALPEFGQWKMLGYGTYVLGLEPANCRVEGRSVERAKGRLQMLQPGETRSIRLEIGVLDGQAAIEDYTEMLKLNK